MIGRASKSWTPDAAAALSSRRDFLKGAGCLIVGFSAFGGILSSHHSAAQVSGVPGDLGRCGGVASRGTVDSRQRRARRKLQTPRRGYSRSRADIRRLCLRVGDYPRRHPPIGDNSAPVQRSVFKVLRVLQKHPDGEWRVHRAMWNTSSDGNQERAGR
jgi:hypothetical protein